jgi:hypothetical protein
MDWVLDCLMAYLLMEKPEDWLMDWLMNLLMDWLVVWLKE